MKKLHLEKLLKEKGFYLSRQSKHNIWTNGVINVSVPHQKEINKMLTKHILKSINSSVVLMNG